MRPGFVFVGLIAVLTATYVLFDGTLSSWMTFILQAVIVIVLLAAATCYRNWRARQAAAVSSAARAETEDAPERAAYDEGPDEGPGNSGLNLAASGPR